MKKYLLLISFCFLAVFQLNALPSRIEKKSFSGMKEIVFEHSYGNITLMESDSKQIELEIQYYDGKDVPVCAISTANDILTIKTILPKYRGNDEVKINYIIAVPRDVAMKVDLKYGNINLNDFYGKFTCDLSYSNLKANEFKLQPEIRCKYGSIKIDKVDVLNLSTNYSNVEINTVNALKVQSKYTDYKINEIKTIAASYLYGNIKIGSVGTIDADLRYSDLTIENLEKSLNSNNSYSDVKINNSSKQLENINFKGSYSDLKLVLHPDLSADFTIELKYGHLFIDGKYSVKYTLLEEKNNKTIKQGTIGNKTPTANIVISDTYSNVSINVK